MRPRRIGWWLAAVAAFLVAALALRWDLHQEAVRIVLERRLNAAAGPLLAGSLRIDRARLGRDWRLSADGVHATLNLGDRQVPVRADRVASLAPVTWYFQSRAFPLQFEGLRPAASRGSGVRGLAVVTRGPAWNVEVQADVDSVSLHDLEWVSPEHLGGSTGQLNGTVGLRAGRDAETFLQVALAVDDPGGRLPAKFFDALVPYLPAAEQVAERVAGQHMVDYRSASLAVLLPQSDTLTAMLRISIPSYNLQLNLNVDVRVDARNALDQIWRVLKWLPAS